MIKKLNKILTINFILSFLPLLSSILTNLCIVIVCMMGENITHIDGYSTMGTLIFWGIAYFPFWIFAVAFYLILWILILIFTNIAIGCNKSNKKGYIPSKNKTVNTISYIMVVWLLIYSIFEVVSIFVLCFLCYNAIVFLIWCFVGALYMGSLIMFIFFTILHTTYINEFKQTQMRVAIKRE